MLKAPTQVAPGAPIDWFPSVINRHEEKWVSEASFDKDPGTQRVCGLVIYLGRPTGGIGIGRSNDDRR